MFDSFRRTMSNKTMNQPSLSVKSGGGKAHYYWLDLIRFFAAFAVMSGHYRGAFLPEYSDIPADERNIFVFLFYTLTHFPAEAVLLFFVLSGFLVGGKVIERCGRGTFDTTSYAIDRSVRILLPLISALLLSVVIDAIRGVEVVPGRVIGNLFSLQGIWCASQVEVLWSLSYEVWFYIVAGCIGFLVMQRRTGKTATLGYVAMGIALLVFTKLDTHYLFIWILGALAYTTMPKSSSRGRLWLFGVLSLIALFMLQLNFQGNYSLSIVRFLPTDNRAALSVIFAIAACLFVQNVILFRPKSFAAVRIDRAGTWLAAFSYTLYLVHVPIMRLMEYLGALRATSFNPASLSLYFGYMLVGMAGSYLIYLLFEKRTPKVKRFIRTRVVPGIRALHLRLT